MGAERTVRHSPAIAWPDDIRRNLAAFRRHEAATGPRRAAVAVCVLDAGGEDPRVLIAKRVARGRNASQWALPGGKLDPGESPVEGALRELGEEAGISDVEVAGLLDDFVTDSGFSITPVVALAAPGARPLRNPAEIASLHAIPFAALLRKGVPRWREQPGAEPLLQMKLRHDMVVHAPTGALLYQFREVALLGRDTRVAGLAQPEWTRS
jgi:8-oxo-dGTP pyrophosphatase MutT (NUDIX family)